MKIRWIALIGALSVILAACAGTTGGAPAHDSGAVSDGIGVHGAWTVDIINPDGTLDQHYEFHNELATFAGYHLAQFLARDFTIGLWNITVGSPTGEELCEDSVGARHGCNLSENYTGGGSYDGLLVVEVTSDLQLTGSFTAAFSGGINSVATKVGGCDRRTSPADCVTEGSNQFTSTLVSDPSTGQPFAVTAGQIVQIQVDISFDTLPTT